MPMPDLPPGWWDGWWWTMDQHFDAEKLRRICTFLGITPVGDFSAAMVYRVFAALEERTRPS